MSLKDFEIGKLLGKGAFGSVNLVKRKEDGITYAMKRVKIAQLSIKELEKELALKCTDFKSAKDISDYRHGFLQKSLSSKESIVELVENSGSLFALVLNKSKGVIYVPIGNISSIQNTLQKSIDDIYHDEHLADFIWGNINKVIPNVTNVYYLPIGKFNQIALGSLYLGQNQYLCDVVNLRLLQDPTTLNNKKQLMADSQLFGASNNVGMVICSAERASGSIATSYCLR